jgi:hypothetical protein
MTEALSSVGQWLCELWTSAATLLSSVQSTKIQSSPILSDSCLRGE